MNPEFRVRLEPATETCPPSDLRDVGERTKFGGNPDWIQGDETPLCTSCGSEMQFVAQIDSIGGDYMFSDAGMLYVFYCNECNNATALLQSH